VPVSEFPRLTGMKFLVASFFLLTQALPPLLGPLIPETGGRVVGIVRRSDTGQPIPGAQVALAPTSAPAESAMTQAVMTDNNGRFTMKGISPGLYTVIAQADGYFSFLNDPVLASRAKKDVAVAEGLQLEIGTIELLPAAAISGRVSAPDGRAVREHRCRHGVLRLCEGRLTFNLTKTVSTDDLGNTVCSGSSRASTTSLRSTAGQGPSATAAYSSGRGGRRGSASDPRRRWTRALGN
jgi:hypothetical protein